MKFVLALDRNDIAAASASRLSRKSADATSSRKEGSDMRDKSTGHFRPFADSEYICSVWFERDRSHIRLETPNHRTIFELWDEDVQHAIEDGFLTQPRVPRPSDEDWQPCAVAYARSQGLIK